MKYEVIKPFTIGPAEFYVGDVMTEKEMGAFFGEILASGSLRAKSDKPAKVGAALAKKEASL